MGTPVLYSSGPRVSPGADRFWFLTFVNPLLCGALPTRFVTLQARRVQLLPEIPSPGEYAWATWERVAGGMAQSLKRCRAQIEFEARMQDAATAVKAYELEEKDIKVRSVDSKMVAAARVAVDRMAPVLYFSPNA